MVPSLSGCGPSLLGRTVAEGWKERCSARFAAYPIYTLYSPGSLRRLRFSDSYSWEVDLNTEEIGAES